MIYVYFLVAIAILAQLTVLLVVPFLDGCRRRRAAAKRRRARKGYVRLRP